MAKKKAEEEEEQRIRKLAEARRALELKREQERERELERLAAAERYFIVFNSPNNSTMYYGTIVNYYFIN